MMKKILIFLTLSAGFNIPLLAEMDYKSYYIPSAMDDKNSDCSEGSFKKTIQKNMLPKESLDQGETGTCFAHAALYQLQFHSNWQQYKNGGMNSQSSSLDIINILGGGCHEEIGYSGYVYEVLFNLRGKNLAQNLGYNIEEVIHFNDWVQRKSTTVEDCQWALSNNFNLYNSAHLSNLSDLISEVDKILHPYISGEKDWSKLTYELLVKSRRDLKEIKIPPYNVEIFEPTKESLIKKNLANNFQNKVMLVKSKLKDLFFQPAAEGPYPVVLTFCPYENKDQSCDNLHSATITGVREVCCQGKCVEEWKIKNSYGGDEEGWFQANFLAESLVKSQSKLTYISPCSPSDCKAYIQGPYPMHYAVKINNLPSIIAYLQEDSSRWQEINLRDEEGNTPLFYAVRNNQLDVVKFFLQHGGDLKIKNNQGKSPWELAKEKNNAAILKLIK